MATATARLFVLTALLPLACGSPPEEEPRAVRPVETAPEVLAEASPEVSSEVSPEVSSEPPVAPAPAPEPQRVAEPAPVAVEPPPAALPWDGAAPVESNAGSYVVQYRTDPETIPWGEPFELEVWVLSTDGTPRALSDVELTVDAAMPEHGHGMNRVPEVERTESGRFEVDGMLLHMPGRWELYFDVGEGALTERAQIEVELE